MSVEIIAHRGIKNILYDNSVVGILAAVLQNRFCEFDVLWVAGEWRICHDFASLSVCHSRLSDLLSCLAQHKHLVKHKIIVDIKWDFVRNRQDSIREAIGRLREHLSGWEEYPFWLQASHSSVLEALVVQCGQWKRGMIVYTTADLAANRPSMDYAMVSLPDFSTEEIIHMSQQLPIIGYTCHNRKELSQYKHLFRYLKGVVCDVCM